MAPVCKFYQQGSCRFGDKCKFEHPGSYNQQYNNNNNNNRFAALDHYSPNDRNNGYQNGRRDNQSRSQGASSEKGRIPYNLDKEAIILDLGSERPQWPLSAYGPGRMAPIQLFGGPLREQSPEEMRLLHYIAAAGNNPQQAIQEAEELVRNAEQQTQVALNDVDGAIEFIIKGENEHPNRLDTVKQSQEGAQGGNAASAAFTQPSATPTGAFGAPSQPGTNLFGAPSQPSSSAFGTQAAGTAFGQPLAMGQQSNPFGAPAQPAFGAPSQLGAGGGFGQTSALGQKPNPFGANTAPSSSGAGTGFSAFSGSKNPFGQPSQTPVSNPFGQPSLPATSNPFGQPSQPATTNAFGQPSQPAATNAFGQPLQSAATNVFGQPSQPATTNLFGQPSQPTANAFGQPLQPTSNAFEQSSQTPTHGFGAPAQATTNAFGQPSQPASINPFGQPALQTNPFGQPPQMGQSNAFGPPASLESRPPAMVTTLEQVGTVPVTAAAMDISGPSQNGQSPFGQNPFGAFTQAHSVVNSAQEPSPYGPNATLQHPSISSYSSKDGTGRLAMFKGKQVKYKDGEAGTVARDGTWEKIWFPAGAPIYYKDTELQDSAYDEPTKMIYMRMRESGIFDGGIMPIVPPKREWCLWDF